MPVCLFLGSGKGKMFVLFFVVWALARFGAAPDPKTLEAFDAASGRTATLMSTKGVADCLWGLPAAWRHLDARHERLQRTRRPPNLDNSRRSSRMSTQADRRPGRRDELRLEPGVLGAQPHDECENPVIVSKWTFL